MSAPDLLEIVNGPEDGTEFPISRAPVIVGMDIGCDVNVRLDAQVERFHARLTTVPDGYRVRKIGGGKLLVGGKRVGVFRSRVLRNGTILAVGNTEFCLRCTPEGLAKRSRGVPTESDLFWAVQTFAKRAFDLLRVLVQRPESALVRFLRTLAMLYIGAAVAGYFWPGATAQIRREANRIFGWIMNQVSSMTGGPF